MKRKQYSAGSTGKNKVAVKNAGKEAARAIPGKKSEVDVTQSKTKNESPLVRKLKNRQL